jgi:hypothetical protein
MTKSKPLSFISKEQFRWKQALKGFQEDINYSKTKVLRVLRDISRFAYFVCTTTTNIETML